MLSNKQHLGKTRNTVAGFLCFEIYLGHYCILNKSVIIDVLFAGMLMWLIAFATYILYFLFHGISLRGIHTAWISYMTATTVTYTSIVFCQYVSLLFRRIWPNKSIFTSYLRSNKKLLWAFLISFIGVLILVYVPVIRDFFAFGSMQLVDWLFPIAGWLLFLVICELNKKRRRNKSYARGWKDSGRRFKRSWKNNKAGNYHFGIRQGRRGLYFV